MKPFLRTITTVAAAVLVAHATASPTVETTRIAKFYDMTTGTLAAGFWNTNAAELIRNAGTNGPQAARVLATMNMAMMDAVAACHDTKYTYWVPRPSQADPSIKPLIGVPNHPAYPSNHSCIFAGLHYRFDVTAGEDIGRGVAGVAVARHEEALARLTRTLLAQHTLQ